MKTHLILTLCSLCYAVAAQAGPCNAPRGKLDLDPCESKPKPPPITYQPEPASKPPARVHPTVVTPTDSKGRTHPGPGLAIPFGGGNNNDKPK